MLFDGIYLSILDKRINFGYYFSHIFKFRNTKFMKKVLLLSLLVAMTVGLSAQSQRMALLEHFTSASCPPCAAANPNIEAYFNTTSSNVVSIKYQGNFGYDPMEDHNPVEAAARFSYYNGSGVPNSVIDGTLNAHPNTYFTSAGASPTMDAQSQISSDFDISVFHSLNNAGTGLDVTAVITASGAVANANLVAHVVVVEKLISFASAPGSNGEKDFHNVMKKMLPSQNGTDLQDVWANGNTVVVSEVWNLANVYNIGELAVVAFVQDVVTKEVYQAGYSETIILPANMQNADLTATTQGFANTDYCVSTYTPEVNVANSSNSDLDSVAVSYTKNGGAGATQVVAINGGSNANVTFSPIGIAFGDEVVFNTTIQDYGFIDLSSIDNSVAIDNFVVLDPNFDNGTALDIQWNNGTFAAPSPPGAIDDNPDGILAGYIDNSATAAVTWNLGGNGNSNGCFFWDFFTISAGQGSSLIFEDIDLSGTYNNMLSFTYAYAQYSAAGTAENLTVSASEDCGATWVELFNKSGAALSTAALTTSRFFPNVNDWDDVTVVMSMFDNKSDVILKITGLSDYGNSLYIDDVATSNFLVSTEDVKLETSLNVYPNPTVDNFTLEFELTEATKLDINLVNGIGQTVRSIDNSNFNSGEHLINVNTTDLAAGTYFITIRNQEGVTTKTITVIK
jgi:hypothetical protein